MRELCWKFQNIENNNEHKKHGDLEWNGKKNICRKKILQRRRHNMMSAFDDFIHSL